MGESVMTGKRQLAVSATGVWPYMMKCEAIDAVCVRHMSVHEQVMVRVGSVQY